MAGVTEGLVVSSPPRSGVWANGLPRQPTKPACIPARGRDRASDHYQLRAGRGLVLRFREAGDDRGCRAASAAFAPQKPTGARARRKGTGQLGIASELAGPPKRDHGSIRSTHLSARCGSHEWIRKVLCFSRDLDAVELHDAHGVRRLAVICQDELGDPKITAANDASDSKPLRARLTDALVLYVASTAGSLA